MRIAVRIGRLPRWWRYRRQPPPTPPTPVIPDAPVPPAPPPVIDHNPMAMLDTEEADFLERINAYRRQHGRGELVPLESLNRAAYSHSLDMGKRGYFSHTSPEGTRPTDRARTAGYHYPTGENIAAGKMIGSAQGVFTAWKNSPGHNTNMLNARYVVIGIGRVEVPGSKYTVYWTTNFGTVR